MLVAVQTYKVIHGTAPRYLGMLVRVSDLPGRRRPNLRSASTVCLAEPPFKLSSIGSGTLKVATARTREGLPENINLTSSPTLPIYLME